MEISECLFCKSERFRINREMNLPAEESIIWEDENVYITPDLFPLSIGHFLIITKHHYHSYGYVPKNVFESCQNGISFIKREILKKQRTIVFEHGATKEKSGGSSINHAHMHIMPLETDIRPLIDNSIYINGEPTNGSYSAFRNFSKRNCPYIYFRENSDFGLIYPVKRLPSQFLRSIIAQEIDIPYNWKNMRIDCSAKKRFTDTLLLAKGVKNEKFI